MILKTHIYLKHIFYDEILAIKELIFEQKLLISTLIIIMVGSCFYLKPFHPKRVVLATANIGSGYALLGDFTKHYFKDRGIDLIFKESSGSVENAELLNNNESGIDAAFIQGGAISTSQIHSFSSLGSIAYEPVWVFYKKELINKIHYFKDITSYKVGIGPEKGGTKPLVRDLLRLEGKTIDNGNFITDDYKNNLNDFLVGKLDVIIIVTPTFDTDVQTLLRNPNVELLNFELASAYEKKLAFIDEVNLPRASIDLEQNIPSKDIKMIATTTSFVVQNKLHPDIQLLLLMAIKEESRNSMLLFFNSRNKFPAYMDPAIPESPVATHYYDYGLPDIVNHLPFWMAGFINRMWVAIIAFLSFIYTISKLNVRLRAIRYHIMHHNLYEELLGLEKALCNGDLCEEDKIRIKLDMDKLNTHAISGKVPVGLEAEYFQLLHAIELLRIKVARL
ncbi:MAG: TAXI family TRAP transporter solute-binding subunit [Methylococcaceae bacterium]